MTVLWPIEELGVVEDRKIGTFPVPMPMVAERHEPEVTKFLDACFALAPEPGITTRSTRAVTAVEMPKKKQWVIVEFVKIDRVPASEYAKMQRQVRDLLQGQRTIELLKAWFDPEQVKKRTRYAAIREEQS